MIAALQTRAARRRAPLALLTVVAALLCSGCAVVAVADAVVTATAVVVKTGVKAAGAVVDAVIPDSKEAKK
jgi:hypothetical protein